MSYRRKERRRNWTDLRRGGDQWQQSPEPVDCSRAMATSGCSRVFWLLQVNWGMGHKKTPCKLACTGSWFRSLAIPYFRMANCHTIIGARRFHFRVRDGIGWFTPAMVTKQTGLAGRLANRHSAGFACLDGNLYFVFSRFGAVNCNQVSHQSGLCPYGVVPWPFTTQAHWVLYGQASRAISTR